MDFVDQTLRNWATTPFTWGATDCAMSVLAYAEVATGLKVKVRPTHKGPKTAKLLLALNGGFSRYASAIVKELGLEQTTEPARGDVGLIDVPGQGLTMCLSLGRGWIAKGDREVLFVKDAKPVIAWKVPLCRKP